MHNDMPQRSATIIPFPKAGRSARSDGLNGNAKPAPIGVSVASPRIMTGAWYHDEAIADAAPWRKQ